MGTPREVGPEQNTLRETPGGTQGGLVNMTAYLAAAIGYVYTLLAASHLTLLSFALVTLLTGAWVIVFWLLSCEGGPAVPQRAALVALAVLALGVQFTAWLGTGFDWLLPVTTAAIVGMVVSRRVALVVAGALFAGSVLAILGLAGTSPSGMLFRSILPSALSLLPAYVFAVIFSIFMQRQQLLRERAEDLADEVSRSKSELEEANAQLRRFSDEVEELAVIRERNRMAREIHDTLGHYLTILAVQLETATRLEERADPRLHGELVEARRVAAECLAEVRRSVAALRPADLAAASFAEALRRLVGELEATAPGLDVTLDLEGPAQELAPELRTTLYRCAQEAFTNVRKHAYATKVLVRLRVEAGAVELMVLDNGKGSAHTTEAAPGFGLVGMRERVALLDGTIAAGPEPEHGWRVEVRIPRAGLAGEAAGEVEHRTGVGREAPAHADATM